MKNNRFLPTLIGMLALSALLPGCIDDDETSANYQTALVTVCPDDDETFVMNLDDATVLYPTNIKTSPFGKKEVRALVNYNEVEETAPKATVKNVHVIRIDSIRTKNPVASLADNDAAYGNDPVEIVKDWVTIAEDGYLTMRIRTRWGDDKVPHVLNLVTGTNPADPFEMELHHDAGKDTDGRLGDALIAFNLNSIPELKGTVKIKLRWNSFSGEKSAEFNLKMRQPGMPSEPDASFCHRNIE